MKIKHQFLIFISLIHLVLFLFAIQLLDNEHDRYLFLVAEALIIISIFISYKLYRSFIRPLELISLGIESIKSKDFNTKFVNVGHYELDQLVNMYNTMIDALREERITRQEQFQMLSKLIEASPVGIIILNFDSEISDINPSALELLASKKDILIGKKIDSSRNELLRKVSHLNEKDAELFSLSNGRKFRCQKSFFIDRGFEHYFILIQEITEELAKAEKQSYEKIIRLMAHEVNNSIGAVNSMLGSFKFYSDKLTTEDTTDFNEAINVSITRNSHLNGFMKGFADLVKLVEPKREIFDLVELMKNMKRLHEVNLAEKNIQLKLESSVEKLLVSVDVLQIEHVVINIIRNAAESIGKNGTITIIINETDLLISDDGAGIPSEIEEQLFTPFFTTKLEGQGIGLMLIRDILNNHKFAFSLKTENMVTTFRIAFK